MRHIIIIILCQLGGLNEKSAMLLPIHHLVISACGTSFFAGQYGAKIMRHLRSFDTVRTTDAGEVDPDDFPKDGGGLLVLSQSGLLFSQTVIFIHWILIITPCERCLPKNSIL